MDILSDRGSSSVIKRTIVHLTEQEDIEEPKNNQSSINRVLRESWFTRQCAENDMLTPFIVLNKVIPAQLCWKNSIPDVSEPYHIVLQDPFAAETTLKRRLLLPFIEGENLETVYFNALENNVYHYTEMQTIELLDTLFSDLENRYHKRSLIHSDITVSNIILSAEGQLKIIDNDLCKLRGEIGFAGTIGYIPEEALTEEYCAAIMKIDYLMQRQRVQR